MEFKLKPIVSGTKLTLGPPKERPRIGARNVYMTTAYRNKQAAFLAQMRKLDLPTFPSPCTIEILYHGNLSADIDNAVGFLLDCFVKGGYLVDDSPTHLKGVSAMLVEVLVPKKSDGYKKSLSRREKQRHWEVIVRVSEYQRQPIIAR